jgi:predicted esterase
MKKKLTLLSCLSLIYFILGFSTVNAQQTFQTTTESVIGLLQYLPPGYDANSNKYPLVIFLHGIGERGANSTNPATLESTIYSVDNLGPPKYAKDGYNFPFILVSPQLKNNYGSWPTSYVMEVINWAKNKFRVDEKRIYITGLSLGGGGTWSMLQDYPQLFASSAVICGGYNTPSKASRIAAENLPVWAFHGDADPTVPLSTTVNMVNAINACQPTPNPKAKLTIYPGVKHDAWNRAYVTDHTYHNPNVYEWMLSYTNTKNGSNYIPTANAGADKSYSSVSTISLSGSGADSDGSISSYRWTKISGPSVTISSSTAASTSVSPTTAGTYVFRLTVTDNGGATDSDYITVVVGGSSSTTNAAPTASAGSDVSLTLPSSTAKITGSGQDSDGSIKSYSWTKISGGTASLSGPTSPTLTAYKLVAGTYIFRLTVTDDKGATGYDDVTVVVKPEGSSSSTSTTTTAPVANAGSNITLTLPSSTAKMYGSATDADGTIRSYSWAKVSGPSANLSNATTSTLTAWRLVQGTYVFRLTVTDDEGATDYDDVTVVVNP